jgi:hypothetical protein
VRLCFPERPAKGVGNKKRRECVTRDKRAVEVNDGEYRGYIIAFDGNGRHLRGRQWKLGMNRIAPTIAIQAIPVMAKTGSFTRTSTGPSARPSCTLNR